MLFTILGSGAMLRSLSQRLGGLAALGRLASNREPRSARLFTITSGGLAPLGRHISLSLASLGSSSSHRAASPRSAAHLSLSTSSQALISRFKRDHHERFLGARSSQPRGLLGPSGLEMGTACQNRAGASPSVICHDVPSWPFARRVRIVLRYPEARFATSQ